MICERGYYRDESANLVSDQNVPSTTSHGGAVNTWTVSEKEEGKGLQAIWQQELPVTTYLTSHGSVGSAEIWFIFHGEPERRVRPQPAEPPGSAPELCEGEGQTRRFQKPTSVLRTNRQKLARCNTALVHSVHQLPGHSARLTTKRVIHSAQLTACTAAWKTGTRISSQGEKSLR